MFDMSVTLEQLRTLDAVARRGSLVGAAEELGKGHTAIIYSLKSLEEVSGLKLLDRSRYRTKLTAEGERFWKVSQKVLDAEREIEALCQGFQSGWEPSLKLVYDGVFPLERMIKTLAKIKRSGVSTEFQVRSAFLEGVEAVFEKEHFDLMISIVEPERLDVTSVDLEPIRSFLVAEKSHPLVQGGTKETLETLRGHSILRVRGTSSWLKLPTRALEGESAFLLNDFQTKKLAILHGLGYGWLPEYLIKDELKSGQLRVIRWEKESEFVFQPRLSYWGKRELGRAAQMLLDGLGRPSG